MSKRDDSPYEAILQKKIELCLDQAQPVDLEGLGNEVLGALRAMNPARANAVLGAATDPLSTLELGWRLGWTDATRTRWQQAGKASLLIDQTTVVLFEGWRLVDPDEDVDDEPSA